MDEIKIQREFYKDKLEELKAQNELEESSRRMLKMADEKVDGLKDKLVE